jgi:FlaA1/EpsC-like NDP-sugar epimerase
MIVKNDLLHRVPRIKYLIFGGTGSLGKVLTKKLLSLNRSVVVFSRDEAKHVVFRNLFPTVKTIIGDVRDFQAVSRAIRDVAPDVVIFASAMKNVPEAEQFPMEAVKTNVLGTENVLEAVCNRVNQKPCYVLSISTDKATSPNTSYGFAKALQERVHLSYNAGEIICNAVRYGNVLESRGSVIPFYKERIKHNQTLPLTDESMTRFFMSLDQSVDLILDALDDKEGGKVFIPKVKSAYIKTLAEVMCDFYEIDYSKIELVGIRPGEKIHESLVSLEETFRAEDLGKNYIIHDVFTSKKFTDLTIQYSSDTCLMTKEELKTFLYEYNVFSQLEKQKITAKEYGIIL